MPYPRYKTFQKWGECPRCGFDYPKSQLTRDHIGTKVCPECWSEDGFEENRRRVNLRVEELNSDERVEPII